MIIHHWAVAPLAVAMRKVRIFSKLVAAFYRHMSDHGSTHLERTASLPRESVTAVGTVVQVTDLSKTVRGISIHVPDTQFKFKAGQWVDFTIPGVETVGGFSMCSSPGKLEKHRLIDLAVKRSDHPPAYWMHTKCQVGSQVSLKAGGDFFHEPLKENSKNLLLIAGGVGINPLYSIIKQISELSHKKMLGDDLRVSLLYSASSVDELIFKDDLRDVTQTSSSIECQFFVTKDCSTIDYDTLCGINSGRITSIVLQEAISTFTKDNTLAYVCGPTPMINFVTATLQNFGLNKKNIKKEEWW